MIRAIAVGLFGILLASQLTAQTVEITNNQPFAIRMPWALHSADRTVLVDVPPNGRQTIPPDAGAPLKLPPPSLIVRADDIGSVQLEYNQTKLGRLQWGIVLEKLERKPTTQESVGIQREYDKLFEPRALKFEDKGGGELFETWAAEASKDGLKLTINLIVYRWAGFIDIRSTLVNESAPRKSVYAAVVCRWEQPAASARSINYDNHIVELKDGDSTPFRAGGDKQRHLMIQRGVDWFNTTFNGTSVAWLNDFASSFTAHREATAKFPARWVGANTAQLGQEAILKGDALYSITEIARPNIKMYASRLDDNVLPSPEQPLVFTSRLAFSAEKMSDEQVDQSFIAYTGFNPELKDGDTVRLSFGVPFTRFGTAYFPYSTLGENFEQWHMPGQSQNSYWPLSADTVMQWKLFADDIRRDLRIAKAMGFESIRLHHLELIAPLPKEVQDEYLDFFFGELKHLGLKALLDVKLPPARVVELLKKYRPQVEAVEYDNEVLIFGINDDEVQTWKDVYAAVKEAAPDCPVWWTGHTNTGAFDRLQKLGVSFDRVGAHAYMDSVEAIPSSRDYALAVANYAARNGKEPVITEWNWRFLTRMTPEARAQVYPPIFENVLKTRCMPEMYQFQFQESLAMASRTLRGIRHYEQLNLSRRPRPEAEAFMQLIQTYADPASPQRALLTHYQSVAMQEPMRGKARILVSVTNTTDQPRAVTASAEGPGDVSVSLNGPDHFNIAPKQVATAELNVALPADAKAGFYHVFVRFDAGEGLVSYAWVEVRNPGPPHFEEGDKGVHPEVKYGEGALDFDFNRDLAVVYGEQATGWEVESAWLLYQTLESATGRPVKIFQYSDLPDALRESGNLILVGTPASNPLIREAPLPDKSWVVRQKANRLIVGGEDEANVNIAAIDFVLRYWKYAKDSGCRRIPLTDKPIEKGADPNALP
jgi:hypothetical protein